MLVDTHCHLDFDRFDEDREAMIGRAVEAGVRKMIVPAVDLDDIPKLLALAEQHQWLFAAVGVHPNSTAELPTDWLAQIRAYANHHKVVAIGEIGLDYYWDKAAPAVQKNALLAQMALAHELKLPVILHNREADADMLAVLRDTPQSNKKNPGVLHSFMSDWDTAVDAVDLGYYLGFTGPITYKKNDHLRNIAREMPIDRLLVETDAPFLAPQVKRGKRNEPAYVKYIADYIADLRGLAPETLADMTTENAACLFGRDYIYR